LNHNSFKVTYPRPQAVFRNSRYGKQRRPARQGQYINPALYVNQAVAKAEQTPFVPTHNFSDFGLLDVLVQTVTQRGYVTPTPVQDGTIKPAVAGRDIVGLANTGTGKTAAFVLPIIQRLKTDLAGKTAIIIAPTRELAVQIDEEFRAFARGLQLYSALCVGGTSLKPQITQLSRRPQVVIGTPGRLKDLFNQRALWLDRVGVLVLDEADRMLDMGFLQDVRFLLDKMPAQKQSLCFSATMPADIRRLVDGMLHDPVTISVQTSQTSEHVEQNVVHANTKEEKLKLLEDMLRQPDFDKVLIFGQTKWGVQRLADNLAKSGLRAERHSRQ
jgi:superfamily II DNA/RNA helicase